MYRFKREYTAGTGCSLSICVNVPSKIPFTFLKERLKEETLLNPHSIRFYDSHSALWASHRAGIYRQRTEGNVLKAQLVNFHRLTKS